MRRIIPSFVFAIFAFNGSAQAEVPLMSSAQLQKAASHIVVGNVQAVYSTVKQSDYYEDTQSVAEIAVVSVEKGKQIATGNVVYAHYWQKRWIGKGTSPPGSSGHIGVAKGDIVRAYIQRRDRKFQILLPNGFAKLKADHVTAVPNTYTSDLQGKWVRNIKTENGTFKAIKEHKGNTTTLKFYDSEGNVVASKKSEFRLEDTGKVKIFTFFNNVMTAGPQKGQTDKAPKSYIYKVIGDTFVEVNGLLSSNDEEPVAFTWARVKE